MNRSVVLAISGASGAVYSVRLLQQLVASAVPVELTVSEAGCQVIQQELGIELDSNQIQIDALLDYQIPGCQPLEIPPLRQVRAYQYKDLMSPIASGSHRTLGMVVCPCSGGTLGSIASGNSGNLIHRGAEVHLKERRKLILVTRETPLSAIAIENMDRVTRAGAVVLPASPGWYHGVQSIGDLVDFVVARILDQLEIENQLMNRWGADTPDE
ncbi:MAG: 3-octaprenyl-4-hydroxybenzoate carboxy-lyase [Rhodopirellula sp.]|nr:3-octaprenyl-4-hydroxybenzoate carboxy-lyase [Rhodopirellula sp.]MCH2598957.1 UbiX family flavin prenyltransferase [Pirellulales bacterium]|tara:strand:+ start:752 stop:1390 length:639 start_codon:yes stop_codon:yes gene_type:complete